MEINYVHRWLVLFSPVLLSVSLNFRFSDEVTTLGQNFVTRWHYYSQTFHLEITEIVFEIVFEIVL